MVRRRDKKYDRLIAEGSFDPTVGAAEGLERALGELSREGTVTGAPDTQIADLVSKTDEYGRLLKEAVEGTLTATRKKDEQQLAEQVARGLRVLIITSDTSIFEDGSEVQSRYLTYGGAFDELHIIVLTETRDGYEDIVKFGERMWVYPTNSTSWLRAIYDAYRLGQREISFASGFRADIIVAGSPFEDSVVAYFLAQKYHRALLVESFKKLDDPSIKRDDGWDWLRTWMMRFALTRADCVRVPWQWLRNRVVRSHKALEERTLALPLFHNLRYWSDSNPSFSLKERYSQFSFIILATMPLQDDRHVKTIVEACAPHLSRYEQVGLVVLGARTFKRTLEREVLKHKLVGKIVLEANQAMTVSHMKSADVFLNVGSQPEDHYTLLTAAAAGIPVVTVSGVEGGFVFRNEKSGYVCTDGDTKCLTDALGKLIGSEDLRRSLRSRAQEYVLDLYLSEKERHFAEYRTLCEECIIKAARKRAPAPEA